MVMALAAIAYLAALYILDLAVTPSERRFGAGPGIAQRLKVYLEPLSVDAVNEAAQIRVDFTPDRILRGTQPSAPSRDLTVLLTTGDTAEMRVFRANQPMAPEVIRADLNGGSVIQYPFDHYRITLRIQAFEGAGLTLEAGRPLAEEVTVWQGVLGYRISASQVPGSAEGDIGLRFDLWRPDAHIFFALATYGAMVVLACNSLAISFVVFIGRRKAEAALIGALAALVFALPVLRNALPGAPPLGVRADLAIFLWAELAAVLGIALLVLSWVRQTTDR
jgi:hypothetical protein